MGKKKSNGKNSDVKNRKNKKVKTKVVYEAAPVASEPAPVSQVVLDSPEVQKEKPLVRGFMRSIFSHLIFASLAIAAIGAYIHWEGILSRVGGTVCSYEMLGSYGTTTPKTNSSVHAPPLQQNDLNTAWLDARRTYWENKQEAEAAYLALVKKYPDQADIRGELGNIYVKSGRNAEAATQYYEAGLTLLKSKDKDGALKILDLLRDISPSKMEALQQELIKAG